ncbi:Bifunctional homocysteine S-methyltransferase/5,10-methylenetetrahydrofolate reductase [subsurface metagenome]
MTEVSLRERIKQGIFLLDGAMGTQLIARGVEAGRCNDYLNIDSPDTIFEIHRSYLQAGSDAVLTNTFGANKFALARHGFSDKVKEINTAAAKIARRAAGEQKYVLGDIGPSGDFLKPLGNLEPEELKDAFAEQAQALLAGGVDGLIIETMTALDEITIAIEAAKSVCGDLPVFASMAFDKVADGFRTMMGVDVESAVAKMVSLGVDAVGFNCGTLLLDEYVELAGKFVSTVKASSANVLIYAEPNAGKPQLLDGRAVYKVTPEDFASAAEKIHSLGVNLIGGCCGTGPKHIGAVVNRLKKQGTGKSSFDIFLLAL